MMAIALESTPVSRRLRDFAADIKLSHSVFALPWALLATFLASAGNAGGRPYAGQVLLIVACMVTARSFAMALNRLIDGQLDALNRRTARRAIPSGKLSRAFVAAIVMACSIAFVAATSGFGFLYNNWLPVIFGLPVLLFIGAYPFFKRFTRLCHYYLGACLALAPICAWIAIAGNLDLSPFLMAGAVLCWTAGFDIIYACQDVESDRQLGVFSVPAKIGVGPALWVARLTHIACIGMLMVLGLHVEQFGMIYWTSVAIGAALLVVEHSLVKPHDLSKVNLAFFTMNGVISLVIGTLGILDVYL